ncbi:ankyrin repeat domain-containing protein [Wolbachia endosymbiont of Folsomia candida]|uniref:ankyrin repeat domain-containing protein n=1 Tax=Wolbachia endosymbiont of Folsomia candida TaxID=169402 RepID=UPI000AFFECD3|nr:ankyrin repeat domain-containing protein [Wolbachia endosymbiont of Folsomia candida]APR98375.1 hypothetical protein ASM33_03740 [Wolbachia endosymbiont of Folsomia candida]
MLSRATQELFEAIDELNLQKFEKAIKDGADVNSFVDGDTPLMSIISAWAIDGNSEDAYKSMADLLIKNPNININIQNRKQRNTALHMAISFKLAEAVKLLLADQSIDFSIKNDYQVNNYPYPPNRYNDTALEYAKKLGTSEIVRKIEEEIYRRTTLSDQAKLLLKKAKPHMAKALIAAASSAVLVAIVLECGMLHTSLALYAMIALSFHMYLLGRFIFNGVSINSRFHDKRELLISGLASLYCFAVFADIVAGNGYFFASQLLFSVGTPLVLFEEVSSIACYVIDISKSSEIVPYSILGIALGLLLICLIDICKIFRNRSLGPNNPPDARQPEPLSRIERMLIMRAINESMNEVRLGNINIDTELRDIQLEVLRNMDAANAMMREIVHL